MSLRELLDQVDRERARYGLARSDGATREVIDALLRRVKTDLGAVLPAPYVALLREQDGLEWNGLVVHGSDRLVDANLEWRDDDRFADLLVLAEGNLDLYVVHLPTGEPRVVDRVPGNVIDVHDSVESLLAAALDAHR